MAEKPRTMAMIETILSFAIPTASSTGRMRCETAGSPTQPSARDATVIPTWQTERLESRSRSVSRTTEARAIPSCSNCTSRDSRTRTSANSAATKKAFRPTRTRATKRLNEDKRGSCTSTRAHRHWSHGVFVGRFWREVRPSRYGPDYTLATRPHKYAQRKGPNLPGRALFAQSAVSFQPSVFGLVADG